MVELLKQMKGKANGLRWRDRHFIEIRMAQVALLALLLFSAFIALGYLICIHFNIL